MKRRRAPTWSWFDPVFLLKSLMFSFKPPHILKTRFGSNLFLYLHPPTFNFPAYSGMVNSTFQIWIYQLSTLGWMGSTELFHVYIHHFETWSVKYWKGPKDYFPAVKLLKNLSLCVLWHKVRNDGWAGWCQMVELGRKWNWKPQEVKRKRVQNSSGVLCCWWKKWLLLVDWFSKSCSLMGYLTGVPPLRPLCCSCFCVQVQNGHLEDPLYSVLVRVTQSLL